MKFSDFFSGIYRFQLGMELPGHECIVYCEKDKYTGKSYRDMHKIKEECFGEDITKVRAEELPFVFSSYKT